MRSAVLPRPVALPRPSRRTAVLCVVALAAIVPLGLWVRQSPLVAATKVQISGTSGADSDAVRAAIRDAAQGMSTLAVDPSKIASALERYPIVRDVDVRGRFPHTLTVTVHQYVPVAAVVFAGRREAVAQDGTLLVDTSTRGLPPVSVRSAPTGHRLTERDPLRLVALLGAAPAPLLRYVQGVSATATGLTVVLANGPKLYFGPATRLRAKWLSAARVLQDPSSAGAQSIDVRFPERPAAGGLERINPEAGVEPTQ